MSGSAPQREAILTALEQLLAWPEIARSPQLGRFLDYIVRRTLDGDEQAIKAYSIAVDVFGRAADFDPQVDPIVRVQARRLRTLLDVYYGGPGLGDAIRIQLPVGRYVPDFVVAAIPVVIEAEPLALEVSESAAAPPPKIAPPAAPSPPILGPRPGIGLAPTWFALAVIALGAALMAYALSTWGPRHDMALAQGGIQRPSITVVEFQSLANGTGLPPQVAGLAIELVTDLEQFRSIAVRYGGGGEGNIAISGLPSSDYVLTGIVRPDGAVMQYSAILTDSRTGSVVWNHTLAVSPEAAAEPGVLDVVSRSLSLVLGSPRGPLHSVARQFLDSGAPADGINPYLCRMEFDRYRESGGSDEAERASACYAALTDTEQQSAPALAAMASLMVEQGPPLALNTKANMERFRLAEINLERALGLDPVSSFVWEQMGRLHQGQGLLAAARSDFRSAVQLNPANGDALAAFGLLLALDGRLDEAEPLARDAVDGTPNPPPRYQGVPTLLALRDGDFAKAVAGAELYALADRELGPILAIMAAQGVDDSAVVNRYLPQVLDVPAFRAKGVLPRLRERISDVVLMEAIRVALISAGVPLPALIRAF